MKPAPGEGRRSRLRRDWLDPEAAQREYLMDLLMRNAGTEYGRGLSFASMRDEGDFKGRVPATTPESVAGMVARLARGENGLLTAERVEMFAKTSGTTAEPKLVPVTGRARALTAEFVADWLSLALADHKTLLDGGVLLLTGSETEGVTEGGVPFGSASGMFQGAMPEEVRRRFAAPGFLSATKDPELRYFAAARTACARNVSFVATPNPLTLANLAKTMSSRGDEIVRSIRDGRLCDKLRTEEDCLSAGFPPGEAAEWTKPDKARARVLDKILETRGALTPGDVWPSLALAGCWLGGGIGFHARLLDEHFPGAPRRDIGYMASEGCFCLPASDFSPAGALALRNNYYEFVPEDESFAGGRGTLGAAELEEGRRYRIILTNDCGLYRYDIGDVALVEGFEGRTPLVSFSRKAGAFLNVSGEKVHLEQLLLAVRRIREGGEVEIRRFRVVPDMAGLRHEWLLDMGPDAGAEAVRKVVLPALDQCLMECNSEYRDRRRSGRLNAPLAHLMRPGWAEPPARADEDAGRDAQRKWRHVHHEFVESDRNHIMETIV